MEPDRPLLPESLRLEGNIVLPLDGRQAWVVRSGSVALFRLRTSNEATGQRRYLFGVDAGEAVLWQPQPDRSEVAIVAVQPSELVAAPMAEAVAAIARGDRDAVGRFQQWVAALGADVVPVSADSARHEQWPADEAGVTAHLCDLQVRFLLAVDRIDVQRVATARERFDERQRLNARVTADTLEGLTKVGRRDDLARESNWSQSPLVAVLRQVGDACGIEIRTPVGDPTGAPSLQRILDASGARSRTVVLSGAWWRRDGEPIVATLAASGEPVGLAPLRRPWFRGVGYRAYFAAAPTREVDAALAAQIAPSASALHPPLGGGMATLAVWRWALRNTGPEFTSALLCGVAVVLVGMLTPQAIKILFETTIPDGDRRGLFELGAALLAAAAGGLLFDLARSLSLLRLAAGTAARLQLGLWDRLLDQGPSFFRRFSSGDLESRVGAVTQIRGVLSVTALATLIGAAASVLNVGLLFAYSPTLALAGLLVAAVAVGVSASSGLVIRRMLGPMQDRDGQLRGMLIQLIGAVPKLKVAGAETRAFAQWGRVYALRMQLAQRLRVVSDRVRLVSAALPSLGTAVLFWFAAADVFSASPALSLGSFVAFSAAFGTFLAGVTTLGNSTELLLSVSSLWDRLRPILDGEPEVQGQRNPPGRLTGRLRLDHVTFRYRQDGPLTLDDVSIEAEPGECIALVGPSGSGKSTIVNLLLRFESASSGAVYLDDHDLKGLDILAVRQQMGVVSQENKILAGSIFDNITSGHQATHDQAWEAAKAAGIDEEIRQMPMGLHTFISEGGSNISGGQRQRLLIARVLLRNPALLILDEATSALDNRSQAIVTESLNRLKVTRILIAHRLSTIRQASRIYVIEAGRVVQHGTFEGLMKEEGLFARLMRRQVV